MTTIRMNILEGIAAMLVPALLVISSADGLAQVDTVWFDNGYAEVDLSLGLALVLGATGVDIPSPKKQRAMRLFECEGSETGKIKGWMAKEELLLDCQGERCDVRFGIEEFTADIGEDGEYLAFAPHYFEFDPETGEAQGVVGAPYYYFVGMCREVEATLGLPADSAATASDAIGTFTLYRSSVVAPDLSIHVATFDASDGEAYNLENCKIAASLFAEQPGVAVRYWCERGRRLAVRDERDHRRARGQVPGGHRGGGITGRAGGP